MMMFWSGTEEGWGVAKNKYSCKASLIGPSQPGPNLTWQVQVESQKQVHAEVRQLFRDVQR